MYIRRDIDTLLIQQIWGYVCNTGRRNRAQSRIYHIYDYVCIRREIY
jgi:hypothetical protein